jgi:flagellar basal-body rod protein FlgF
VDKALYISMTGAKHNMMAQAVHANNLANVNTQGFRADFAQARSMAVYQGEGFPTRAYALTENPGTDFSQGPMIETGNELDFAIEGWGMLAVQTEDGGEAYTRSASLQISPQGQLLTGNGLPVLGEAGPIFIPPTSKVDIGADGTLTITGDLPMDQAQLDRLRLVKPELEQLVKGGDGLFRQRDGQLAPLDGSVRLQSGFIEGSNVNSIGEFTEVLSLSRQYELSIKMMKTVEGNSEASARLLQN